MLVLGMGDDGHIGSLHPNRTEILATSPHVLAVEKGCPASITLSLPVMLASGEVVVAACGTSEKAPTGKAAAIRRVFEGAAETPQSLPASCLRAARNVTWLIDRIAAADLSVAYNA